ncbi:MAG: TetR family transcriptional regulator [Actinobacteria bacterium]|uniref:Unannotated protein n=1 Tax=freshwater metagenome TaxID=449393 RepID=A0A6J6TNK1_9ZZZZ|nr:TetR family transcriptional regulator [Actinomycetota bacterium]MSW78754.1 TetR family transcriptional regulator [Actinomycetota bacterium]MSX56297.1 TetR family transcriptional regulator [Actinomycetota bacterium]MSZ84790.1 TetR family transcriptional regulator [Actinomycetota bacterium]MTB19505.1 TetR family transcriptional regulator [Actinomycetota bacterium]
MSDEEIQRRPPFGQSRLVGERGNDTRRRILDAALLVFGEVGFNAASVELITEAAGCSRPSFYQYFASKDEVFWKLAARLGNKMVRLSGELGVITADSEGLAHLDRWIHDFIHLRTAFAPVFSAYQTASRQDDELAQGSRAFGDRISTAVLTSFGSRHKGPRAVAIAYGIVGVITQSGGISDRVLSARSHDRLVRGIALFIHRVICGPIVGVNLPSPTHVRVTRSPGDVVPAPSRALRPRGVATRQLLLDAGVTLLPQRGFHETRVDDIVTLAGLSHGAFYRYFDSKDDLFRVLAAEANTRMLARIDELPVDEGPAAYKTWLRVWFEEYRTYGGVLSTWQELFDEQRNMIRMSDQAVAVSLNRLVALLDHRSFGDPLIDGLACMALLERLPNIVVAHGLVAEDVAIDAMVVMLRRGLAGKK